MGGPSRQCFTALTEEELQRMESLPHQVEPIDWIWLS